MRIIWLITNLIIINLIDFYQNFKTFLKTIYLMVFFMIYMNTKTVVNFEM